MMVKRAKVWRLAALIGGTIVCSSVQADARGQAMGGVGVASADYLSGVFHNPALTTRYDRDRDSFGMLLPTVSATVHDSEDLYHSVDDFINLSDQIDKLLTDNHDIGEVLLNDWRAALRDLDSGKGIVTANAGMAIAIPQRSLAVSFFSRVDMVTIAMAHVDERDLDLDFDDCSNNQCSSVSEAMHSTVQGLGAAVGEVGVTLATQRLWQVGYYDFPIAFGVTPKVQHLTALNYHTKAADFDDRDVNLGDDRTDKTVFNIDVGMTFSPSEATTVGLTAKNLIPQSLATPYSDIQHPDGEINERFMLKPQFILGIGYNNGWMTVGLDVDLNKRDYFEGIDYQTQFARLGIELDAWRWAQLRLGYQHSMNRHSDDVVSAGLGLTPFGRFGLDISAQYGSDQRYGAGAQLIFTF